MALNSKMQMTCTLCLAHDQLHEVATAFTATCEPTLRNSVTPWACHTLNQSDFALQD